MESVIANEFDDLREAIFAAYAWMARSEHGKHWRGKPIPEQARREAALVGIDEILQCRPLRTFSADHLDLLELMFAYWREVETAEDAELNAPEPDDSGGVTARIGERR